MSAEAWGTDDEYMRGPDGYVTEEHAEEMVREAVESITQERGELALKLAAAELHARDLTLKAENMERSIGLLVESRTEERDALLKDLRKCEQQLIASYGLVEQAALICSQEADRQSAFSNDAKEQCVKLAHSTAAWTCMELAQRIRALCPLKGA